jgi:hypothetical protein
VGNETPHEETANQRASYAWAAITFTIYHVLGHLVTSFAGKTLTLGDRDWTPTFFAHLVSAAGAIIIVTPMLTANHRRSSRSTVVLTAGLTLELSLVIMAYDLWLRELAAWKPYVLGW